MTSRRDFLRRAGGALAFGALPALPGCRPAPDGVRARAAPPLAASAFAGERAGEERAIEGIRVCWCPPGDYLMGSPADEPGRRADEAQVEVTLTRGFWVGKFEATQGEWSRIAGPWPDRPPTARFGEGPDLPMYWVSFDQAEGFCARLTALARGSGALPADWSFRIPTEAQWEYACRAGTTTASAFGEVLRPRDANYAVDPPPRGRAEEATGQAAPVGSYPPNPWGICDMHGNVWEWCRDYFHRSRPGGVDPDLSAVPGMQNRDGSYSRVRRGGAWIEEVAFCRSAARLPYEPHRGSDHIGFRVAVVPA